MCCSMLSGEYSGGFAPTHCSVYMEVGGQSDVGDFFCGRGVVVFYCLAHGY